MADAYVGVFQRWQFGGLFPYTFVFINPHNQKSQNVKSEDLEVVRKDVLVYLSSLD